MNKVLKTHAVLLLLLCCSSFAFGQKLFLDSITVRIDDKTEINLAIYNYKNLSETVERDLKSLQFVLKDNNNIPEEVPYSITYKPDNLLSIKQTQAGERIIWENGVQTRYQFNKQCNINSDDYRLKIQFNNINQLVSDSLITKLKEVIDSTIVKQGRLSSTFNYSFQGEKLIHNYQLDKTNGYMDLLRLSGGVGVSLIKNEPVIDLSAEMAFVFSKKGILKNQYYVSYNQLFDFADSSKVNLNGFLNVGYRYNLSNTVEKPNWLGVELGYLISHQGDLLKKNTFKFGVNWEIGKYLSVSPQLYLSGDLTEFYPAIRIGFGF